jgi:uncharacterized protein (TIGR00290 family)
MNNHKCVVLNWSSGKDAAMAYYKLLKDPQYKITNLLTTVNEDHDRIFMHGIREHLLDLQAERMKLPLIKVKLLSSDSDDAYKEGMRKNLSELYANGVTTAAYGDIFLDDLRSYREKQLEQIGMDGLFPLWKMNTTTLVNLVEEAGIEAIIVCVNGLRLGKEFLGKKINTELLDSLPPDVDPCGENGEFHTFVYNAPFFSQAIPIKTGEIVTKTYTMPNLADGIKTANYYFLDVTV